ncbi:alkaline phosphatase D family protein [Croceicoccus sp. BE223]|uniref:alkaline phosphatase D family protein n=1 Tax=Croceicoccus sp. BE223 TaxID=2817716 RepID=UPI0028643EE0|nr:alkaline phosphatase D family protein [Croceicoccus sp. BE223]MDR7101534.1 alkaline phosphatase D [Croceicoccus sp. BE223]
MSGATISIRTTRNTNVRLAYSTDSGLASPSYSASQVTIDRTAKFILTGLDPNTRYYYGAEIDGILQATIGTFKTLGATTLKVCVSGDASSGSNAAVYDTIRTEAPDLFLHLGDIHYDDNFLNSEAVVNGSLDRVFAQAKPAQLFRDIPSLWIYDDHDFGPNDSHAGSGMTASSSMYRKRAPSYPLQSSTSTDPVYHSFEINVDGIGVVFIVTDQRAAASDKTATDNSSKTMLGTTQKTWFKGLFSNPANDGKLFVWLCSRAWGGVATAGADHWGGFTTERTELGAHIHAEAPGRCLVLSADMHSLAFDNGTNHTFGSEPFVTLQCSPLDRTGDTTYGGATYSQGQYTNNGQFAVLTFAKTGASQITVAAVGKNAAGSTLVTYSPVFNL